MMENFIKEIESKHEADYQSLSRFLDVFKKEPAFALVNFDYFTHAANVEVYGNILSHIEWGAGFKELKIILLDEILNLSSELNQQVKPQQAIMNHEYLSIYNVLYKQICDIVENE